MDDRVSELFAAVQHQGEGSQPDEIRAKIIDLHKQVDDEDSYVALKILYCAVTDNAIRYLVANGIDAQPLKETRTADMRLFCMEEAMGANGLF